ncbi:MAG TPA: hypothetical protein VG871_24105 [Vicinamibacterales bacterium]|nr:hypothetical protein [Vicinamibacterales bacterium]
MTTSPTTVQAMSTAEEVGTLTLAALQAGAVQFGITRVVATGPVRPRAASGETYATVSCPSGGRLDLVYVRDYVPAKGDVDASALKGVYTACAFPSGGSPFQMSGELALTGHYFGSAHAPTVQTSGSLTTSSGPCSLSGSVDGSGAFAGTACGTPVAATPAPTPAPTPTPTPTVDVTGVWSGDGFNIPFQQQGTALTASVTDAQGLHTFAMTLDSQTPTTATFTGTLRYDGTGACNPSIMPGSIVVDLVANTMALDFSGTNADCKPETVMATLQKQ